MLGILKRLFRIRFFRTPYKDPETLQEERWTSDFSRRKKCRFPEETSDAYEAVLEKKAFRLSIKKTNCMAWVEDPLYRYSDLYLEAQIALNTNDSYAAAGLQFRRVDDNSYYTVLISSKGYLRLDLIFNGTPMPLIAWTELPEGIFEDTIFFTLRIIVVSDRISIIINNTWVAEVSDSTIPSGKIAFTAASYEKNESGQPGSIICSAYLKKILLDSRPVEAEAAHIRWNTLIKIDKNARIRLAETFYSMDQPMSALVQLKRAWKNNTNVRSQTELLLASECAVQLSLLDEAQEYLDRCIEVDPDTEEARKALAEKAKILYLNGRYAELRTHVEEALEFFPEDVTLHTLLGHAFWNLGAYEQAASAYDKAVSLSPDTGLIILNAAKAYERLGRREEAVDRYLKAGNRFLQDESYEELNLMLNRLVDLAPDNYRSYALRGKLAYALEDWKKAESELLKAESFEEGKKDPSVLYLKALLLIRKDKRKNAVPFLEQAVAAESDYAPFHFRLAECLFILDNNPEDPRMQKYLNTALELDTENGWIANLAAQVEMARGNLKKAETLILDAEKHLHNEISISCNKAELYFLQNKSEEALSVLESALCNDKNGILYNQKASILYREGRFEQADEAYREALRRSPDSTDYKINRALCLIEIGYYGEADELLSKAYETEHRTEILELISYVASKKGEFPRAEAACRVALETEPANYKILSSLAWIYLSMSRYKQAIDVIDQLKIVSDLKPEAQENYKELYRQLIDRTMKNIACSSCGRSWLIPKNPDPVGTLRLVAEPPDELPAGSCPECGASYCIGCAKNNLDENGRFICPKCNKTLKLLDEGLKRLLADWAEAEK